MHQALNAKSAFTLIELLVVIAMIAVLTGAVGSGVTAARKRANIARATVTVKEMTNAILAYENYDDNHSLESVKTGEGWQECTKGNIGFLLGEKSNKSGQIPILYNAALVNNSVVDPWGNPYRYKIADAGEAIETKDTVGKDLDTFLYLPNMWRIRSE